MILLQFMSNILQNQLFQREASNFSQSLPFEKKKELRLLEEKEELLQFSNDITIDFVEALVHGRGEM